MPTRRDVIVTQPLLIPIAGNYDRKPRSLDRDVTTVGRARGSDLCLEANEISTLHCVIYRTAEGYRIRDCNSRCGCRVNGESVKSALLHDADIVNLGPFSFEFRLPTALFKNGGVRLDPLKVEHWKESRRRLAQRALKLRKRLKSRAAGSPAEADWEQKAHLLKEKIRCYDLRLGELEDAEKELADERLQLAKDCEAHQKHVQEVERGLGDRLMKVDQEIRVRWQEFQQRCKSEEGAQPGRSESGPSGPTRETLHDGTAERRQAIQAQSQRLEEIEEQLNRRDNQLQRVQQEFTTMKEQWVQDQVKASASLEQQQAALAHQKTELLRMMGDLKKMQEDMRRQARPDVRALEEEIAILKQENAELRQTASTSPAGSDVSQQMDALRGEVALLHKELQVKEEAIDALQNAAAPAETSLKSENEELKVLLEARTLQLEEIQRAPAQAPKTESDLERYEAELNEFRRQLENDRSKLNQEVESLRERNKELDEAIREMEMEMSKERAELARERMKLERVREEVKTDMERLQREMVVRDSMAPVQKLRDELNGKPPQPKQPEKPLNDRLRGLRNQLSDSTPTASS